jgi:hypothetical protein
MTLRERPLAVLRILTRRIPCQLAQVNARLEVKSHSRKRPISRALSLAQSYLQDEQLTVLKNLSRNYIL